MSRPEAKLPNPLFSQVSSGAGAQKANAAPLFEKILAKTFTLCT